MNVIEFVKDAIKLGGKVVLAGIVAIMLIIALVIGALVVLDDGSTTEVIWTDSDSVSSGEKLIDAKVENTGEQAKDVTVTCTVDAEGEEISDTTSGTVDANSTKIFDVTVDGIPEGRDGVRILTYDCSVEENQE